MAFPTSPAAAQLPSILVEDPPVRPPRDQDFQNQYDRLEATQPSGVDPAATAFQLVRDVICNLVNYVGNLGRNTDRAIHGLIFQSRKTDGELQKTKATTQAQLDGINSELIRAVGRVNNIEANAIDRTKPEWQLIQN